MRRVIRRFTDAQLERAQPFCDAAHCYNPSSWWTECEGVASNRSVRLRHICDHHARQYARRHHLELPA